MFGKQIVEVCTIVAYWVLFVPLLLVWFEIDVKNDPFIYFFTHSEQVLYLIVGYLVLYRIIRYIFIDFQSFNLILWQKLTNTKAEVDLQLKEGKSYKELDTVDGPPATLSYSNHSKRKEPMSSQASGLNGAKSKQNLGCGDEPVLDSNYLSLKKAPPRRPPPPPTQTIHQVQINK
ncbi:hypothetical protein AWZ03_009250 [Drosophila navojoa]|uniref:Uncharacterized protein n=1 Tax=Drosophila navojoa TaxID=7232 RepID=A0A484B8J1_DRONA|nr:hypothetical protein AWZ03_009250 [Drosophila navojoa]